MPKLGMTVEQAVDYCYKHRNQFLASAYAAGEEGDEQFDCLVGNLRSGHIRPDELADYGMDYGD